MSLFVRVPWSIEEIFKYAVMEDNPVRWDSFLERMSSVAVVGISPKEAAIAAKKELERFERQGIERDRLERVKILAQMLKTELIPGRRIPEGYLDTSPEPASIDQWQQSPLGSIVFFAVSSSVGSQALEPLTQACRSHRALEIIDPYILSSNEKGGLVTLIEFATENGIDHVDAYGMFAKDDYQGLPKDRSSAEDQIERAFEASRKDRTISWEFTLYPMTKTDHSLKLLHDRFLSFRATGHAASRRVLSVGRGVAAFHETGEHRTFFTRVPKAFWDLEFSAYQKLDIEPIWIQKPRMVRSRRTASRSDAMTA